MCGHLRLATSIKKKVPFFLGACFNGNLLMIGTFSFHLMRHAPLEKAPKESGFAIVAMLRKEKKYGNFSSNQLLIFDNRVMTSVV